MTKFCMSVDIHDIITCVTLCDDRLRGLGVARGRISRFPIDLRRRPYNTLAHTTVRVCDTLVWFAPRTKINRKKMKLHAISAIYFSTVLLFSIDISELKFHLRHQQIFENILVGCVIES